MKKIAVAVVFCLGLSGALLPSSVSAQSGRPTRPRVVTTAPSPTTPPPPSSTDDDSTRGDGNNQTKRPPVLIGDSKNNGSSTANTNASTENATEDDEVIRVETNLVTFPVSVLDRNGRFIAGLRENDFQIFEDGAPQKIEYFAPIEQPFTVVLLIDVSPSTAFQIEQIQDAAIAFVNQLRPDDRVIVMAFDERVAVLTRPTNNRALLRDAIRQTNFGNGTSLYEAVDVAIRQQLRQIQGRKAVVLFTDGVDTTSRRASYQSTVRQAEELDAMIYPIRYDTSRDMQGQSGGGGGNYPSGGGGGVLGAILGAIINGGNVRIGGGSGGGTAGKAEYEAGRRYLEDLARTSGGRSFEAGSISNLDAAFSGIAEELRRQYSIGYYPETVGQPGQRKQIRVRTNRPEAVVRSKNSYIVGAAGGSNAATTNTTSAPNTKQPPKMSSRLPF